MSIFLVILVLALFVEAVTYALLKSDLIAPLRDKVKSIHALVDELLSCGYCTSFWVSILTCNTYFYLSVDPQLLVNFSNFNWISNIVLITILTHRLSNLIHCAIDKHLDKSYDKRYYSILDSFRE